MSYREVIFQSQKRQEEILKKLNEKILGNIFFVGIFQEISILLEPIYYKPIFQERRVIELLEKYHNQILKEYDISLDMTPQYIAKVLKKDFKFDKRYKKESSIDDQVDIEIYPRLQNLLIAKSLLGYYLFYNNDYVESFNYFRWCLKLIYLMKRKNKHHKRRKHVTLFSDVESFHLNQINQIINLFCINSLMQDGLTKIGNWDIHQPFNIKLDENTIYSAILYGILENLNEIFSNSNTTSRGKTSKFLQLDSLSSRYQKSKIYETISEIENVISKHNNKIIEYEVNSLEGYRLGICVNCFEIDYMIKFSILSLLSKFDDDPMKNNCLRIIIQGILLFGNVDIRVLHFFYEIYKYYDEKYQKYQAEMVEYCSDITQTIRGTRTRDHNLNKIEQTAAKNRKNIMDETLKSKINETIIHLLQNKNDNVLQNECLELCKHIINEWYKLDQPKDIVLPKLILSNISGSIISIDVCYENENKLIKKINYIKLRVQKKINQYDIENSVINNSVRDIDNDLKKCKKSTDENKKKNCKANGKNKINGYQWIKFWNKCMMDNLKKDGLKVKNDPELNKLTTKIMQNFSI